MLNPEELKLKLDAFGDAVKMFFYAYGLGDLVLDKKIDHASVKALNKSEYDEYIQTYLPLSKKLGYESMDLRQIAVAELYQPLECGEFGNVDILEIMEPKPNAAITTHDMIDHIEIIIDNLEALEIILKDKDVEFKVEGNGEHKAIAVSINEWDQEVKFAEKSILKTFEKLIA